jgi:hypothetical protein
MLSRGKSNHDAVMKWKPAKEEADLAGYIVVVRSTTAPFWEREIYVGNVTEYTLKDTQIDDCVLGIKAIDREGNESPVAAYMLPTRGVAAPAETP